MIELVRDLRAINVLAKFENDPWKIVDVRVLTGLVCPAARPLRRLQYPGALKGCGVKTDDASDLRTVSEWSWPGRGRSWITGLAGISGLGPNSEPRGNNRSFPETRERNRVPVKKIGSRDSIFGLVNSTYFFKITNNNQHASNIEYLANLIKKYWTCFRYQKLADFLVCFPPSVRVQVRWPPCWKICLRIQFSFGFWGRAVKAFDNFSRKLAWLLKTIF